MIELHFQNINHYNTIGPYIHLKISDSLSFFIISAASNVLALFSSNSFSFSWHLKWYIVSSSASNIACGEQKIHNSWQFMREQFLVAGLMFIKSGGYMLSLIYSIWPVKDNHEWVQGGADKSLAQPGRIQATATKLRIYSTYSPRSSIHFLAHCSNFYKPLKKKFRRLSVQPGLRGSRDLDTCTRVRTHTHTHTHTHTQTHMKALELTILYKVRKLG